MYGDAAGYKAYHTARGRTTTASDSAISAALLIASDWLDNTYGNIWVGTPTGGFTQTNLWPRTDAITNTNPTYTFTTSEIPTRVLEATYEAALRELTTTGSLSIDFTPNKFSEARVEGAIAVKYRADFTDTSDVQTQIRVIQNLMYPLIDPTASGSYSGLSGPSGRVV